MDEPVQRFPNGDRKFPSHIELYSLEHGFRLLSAYRTHAGECLGGKGGRGSGGGHRARLCG
jgi:hypothetical protein